MISLDNLYETNINNSSNLIKVDPFNKKYERKKQTIKAFADSHAHLGNSFAVTLTYTNKSKNEASNESITKFTNMVRRIEKSEKTQLHTAWSFEFSENNRPHYHLIIISKLDFETIKNAIIDSWPYGMCDVEICNDVYAYAAYISKPSTSSRKTPKGMRTYGFFSIDSSAKKYMSHKRRPYWVQNLTTPDDVLVKIESVGYANKETGIIYECPYEKPIFIRGEVFLVKKDLQINRVLT